METPILVIGALGNVGTEVVTQLQADGQRVRAADRDEKKLKERCSDSVEAVHFDFLDPETYAETFKGVEKMFLMRPSQIANIKRDMVPAMNAAKQAGVK